MRKRTIAIPLSVLAAAGLAGGAYAASQSSSGSPQAFLKDAAHRLHVSPARLSSALKQAFIDQINAAVTAGHLSAADAKAIKQRIEDAAGLPLLPGLPLLYGAAGPRAFGFRLQVPAFGPPGQALGPPAILTGAASYLGLSDQQLLQQLRSGKSLAQIASARGKSRAGLEHALTTAVKSQLDRAVSAGRLPRALEQHLLQAFSQHIRGIVNGKQPFGFFAPRMRLMPGKPPPPGGAIGPIPPGAGIGLLPPPVMRLVQAPSS